MHAIHCVSESVLFLGRLNCRNRAVLLCLQCALLQIRRYFPGLCLRRACICQMKDSGTGGSTETAADAAAVYMEFHDDFLSGAVQRQFLLMLNRKTAGQLQIELLSQLPDLTSQTQNTMIPVDNTLL